MRRRDVEPGSRLVYGVSELIHGHGHRLPPNASETVVPRGLVSTFRASLEREGGERHRVVERLSELCKRYYVPMGRLLDIARGEGGAPSYSEFNKTVAFTQQGGSGADRTAHLIHALTIVIQGFIVLCTIAWLVGLNLESKYEWRPTLACEADAFANAQLVEAIRSGRATFTSTELKRMGVSAKDVEKSLRDGDRHYAARRVPHPVYATSSYCLVYATALLNLVIALYMVRRFWRFKSAMLDERKALANVRAFEANMIFNMMVMLIVTTIAIVAPQLVEHVASLSACGRNSVR